MFVTSEMLKTIARPFETLSSLLSTAPQPGMRAAALDAPGSMLYEVGGKWGGSFGYVTASQVAKLQAAIASIAIGTEAVVPNAAVPGGLSRLRRCVAAWAPPAGELIAAACPISPIGPIVLVSPGVTTLTKIWESPIIPDYMLPDLIDMEISSSIGALNSVSQVNTAVFGCCIAGEIPVGAVATDYPGPAAIVPASTVHNGECPVRYSFSRRGSFFKHPFLPSTRTSYDYSSAGAFISGSNRLYTMVKPGHVSDQIRFDSSYVWSKGNL